MSQLEAKSQQSEEETVITLQTKLRKSVVLSDAGTQTHAEAIERETDQSSEVHVNEQQFQMKPNKVQQVMRLRTEIKEAKRRSKELSRRIKNAQFDINDFISQIDPTKARILEIGTQIYNSTRDKSELKTFANPTDEVKTVLGAVMVMLDERPDWRNAKVVTSRQKFVTDLVRASETTYLRIQPKTLKTLSKYCQEEYFEPELVRRDSIVAAKLCEWVNKIVKYHALHQQIDANKEIINESSQQMMMIQSELEVKQLQLTQLIDEVTTEIMHRKQRENSKKDLRKS